VIWSLKKLFAGFFNERSCRVLRQERLCLVCCDWRLPEPEAGPEVSDEEKDTLFGSEEIWSADGSV
jgi:hypothetical protein